MRFNVEQQDFLKGLLITQKAINSQNSLPVLGNILLKTEGQKLFLSATNLEISIQVGLNASIKNEGSITVPAKIISNWVNYSKQGDIEVKMEEGNVLFLKTEDAKTKIKGLSADEFPVLPIVERENEFIIKAEDFQKSINEVSFSCAHSAIRPVLSGVLIQGKGDQIQMVATDSYRLSEKTLKLKKPLNKEIYAIVPARTMVELERILSSIKEDKELKVIISQNQILFQIDNIEVVSRLIEGKFPEHSQIIPKTEKTIVVVDKNDLTLAIKRMGIFARENNNNMRFKIEDSKLIITTDITEIGSEEAEIKVEVSGEVNQTSLNGQFLLDVLSVLTDKEVLIKIAEKLSPVIIQGKDNKEFVHVIMPLKI